MRVSADIEDPDYSQAAELLQVFLDGAPVPVCIMADDDAGLVLCYKLDWNGFISFDRMTGLAETIELRGKVEMRVDPRAAPADRKLTAAQLVHRFQAFEH